MPSKNDKTNKNSITSVDKAREELGINIEDYSIDLVPDISFLFIYLLRISLIHF